MYQKSKNLRTSLFGLNKAQVELELEKDAKDYYIQLSDKKCCIDKLRKERDDLQLQLSRLKNDMEVNVYSEDLMEYAIIKAQEYAHLFREAAEADIQRLIIIGENTEKVFNNKISEFDQMIKRTQAELDSVLKEVLYANENLDERLRKFIQKHDINIDEDKSEVKIEQEVQNDVFNKSMYSELELSEIKRFTSGTEEKDLSSSNFWDDESESSEIRNDENLNDSELKERQVKKNIIKQEIQEKDIQKDAREQLSIINGESSKKREDTTQVSKGNEENNTIVNDINNIRLKYLIGKVTGVDLLDRNGNVIVTQNSKITSEVIEAAEREGKLAELIVNMTISEIS